MTDVAMEVSQDIDRLGASAANDEEITSPEYAAPQGKRVPPFAAPKPRLVSKGFVDGRVYQTHQDPDRMNVPHTTPPFVAACQARRKEREAAQQDGEGQTPKASVSLSVDPEVAARITVEEVISLPDGFATVLYNVLSTEECLELIAMGSEKGWSPALVNIGSAQQFLPEVRDHSRCIVDDKALTDELWVRIAPYIPERQQHRQVRGLNDRLRLLCYHKPGQTFQIHRDGNYTRPKPHVFAGDTSYVTVQLYLNEDFTGGATTFFLGQKEIPYQPLSGSVLIFSQNLYHEGSKLESGLKYTLRTDVMYKPREAKKETSSNAGEVITSQ